MSLRDIGVLPGVDADVAAPFRGSVAFIGTATTLIRFGGFTILTDPNFLHAGDHAHIGYGMTARRITDPAIELEALPALDLVLLSHFHGDHFDHIVQQRLNKALPIVTTRHAARALAKKGFSHTRPLDTWESIEFEKDGAVARVTAMPGRHAPKPVHAAFPPVMGEMLEIQPGEGPTLRIYISGDTLLIDELREIPERFPDIDLAVFHLGGTKVMGLMVTMDGRQGAEAVKTIDAQVAIPVHYDDYPLFTSPLSEFKTEVQKIQSRSEVIYLERGTCCSFDVVDASHI